MALTNREKVRRYREKRLKEGLVEFRAWVAPDLLPRLKRYLDKAKRDATRGRKTEEKE